MKYLSLILLLLFITIVSSFTGCCNYREGLDANIVGTAGGAWGGSCTCPDGQVYQVSDNDTYGKELACYGGISGPVNKTNGPWSGKSVTCAPKKDAFKFEGCYSNNPRIFSNWNPNNLINNPNRNNICENRALTTNNKYYGLENNNGCLVFNKNFPSNNKLNIPQSGCINGYQVAVFEKYDSLPHIENPILGTGSWNTPLPLVNATFLKRENPAPAPNQ